MQDLEALKRYQTIKWVTLVGSAFDLVLGVAKITLGYITHSQALIADGIHSLSDLGTDFVVIFAAKQSSRKADDDHPYGHKRIETVVTVGLGVVLILVGLGIAVDAISRLFTQTYWVPSYWALTITVTIVSIATKEIIYHFTLFYARKIRSKMMEAKAWHSRSDAFSSVIVLIGLLGTYWGIEYLDAVAAIGVLAIIIKIGWEMVSKNVRELLDTGLNEAARAEIRERILKIGGVKDLHYLRTRSMGVDVFVDVHILVDSTISVSEGHQISETVHQYLIRDIDQVSDVLVHIDPEDDTRDMAIYAELPPRDKLLANLMQRWQTILLPKDIQSITLHYLEGKIRVEVTLPYQLCTNIDQARELEQRLKQAGLENPYVSQVSLFFCV